MLSCQENGRLGKSIMHPTPYILDLVPPLLTFYDNLKEDFRNLFAMADANARWILRKIENASFQNSGDISLER